MRDFGDLIEGFLDQQPFDAVAGKRADGSVVTFGDLIHMARELRGDRQAMEAVVVERDTEIAALRGRPDAAGILL